MSSFEPRQVGPFTLRGILGRGGQGTVYLGEHSSGQQAAVKVLHLNEGTEKARQRIERELAKLRRVPRHWTAEVLDAGVAGEVPYIATEYIEGKTLHEVVKSEGPLSRASLHRVAFQTIDALTVIHGSRVVHRDFKPANVLRGPDGWVVIDFGIAGIIGVPDTTQPRGTLLYMAPEQFGAATGVGEDAYAMDVFAWASTMVFAGTGKMPFQGESMFEVMRTVVEDEPDLHGLDGPLAEVLRRCFIKDPAERPSATEVHALLRRHDTEPALTTTAPALTAPSATASSATVPSATVPPTAVPLPVMPPATVAPDAAPRPQAAKTRRRSPGLVVVSAAALTLLVPSAVWAATEIRDRAAQPAGPSQTSQTPSAPPAPQALPAGLQKLVPQWSPTSFASGVLRANQVEKWVHHSKGISVSIIRYDNDTAFSMEYEAIWNLHERSKSANWRSGTAKNSTGLKGRYVEYEVVWEDGTENTSIWWDDSTTNADSHTVIILQAVSTTPRATALNRLRDLLKSHNFTIPG
ncbi:serine/threonine protein kinase [Actinoplanes solisilvae]|uniref:serine/threonine protein kinase n=1 Tax=Actinoplanes solisilvae TaxID=2486853 RepID=UPI000FD6C665|nr:serine/threonine-protein kinase [Actinoplanes solisilvae]